MRYNSSEWFQMNVVEIVLQHNKASKPEKKIVLPKIALIRLFLSQKIKDALCANVMFRVMFLSYHDIQRPTFVDTRAQFSLTYVKTRDASNFAFFFKICKRPGHNSRKMTSKYCVENFSFLSEFFQSAKLTQSSKILKKSRKKFF